MHALRIAHQGHEPLSARQMTLPLPEPERARLMAVRRGEMPLARFSSASASRPSACS